MGVVMRTRGTAIDQAVQIYREMDALGLLPNATDLMVRTPAPMNRQAVARVTIYRAIPPVREEHELFAEIDWGFRRQARGFVAALLGGAQPLAPGEDCLKDVAILEDVMRKATFA